MTTYSENIMLVIRDAKRRNGVVLSMDIIPPPGQCENCGGLGEVYVFVTETGPFRDVPPGTLTGGRTLKSIEDPMYGWVWYTGKTVGGMCPTCNGLGKTRPALPDRKFDTVIPIKQLAIGMGK